MDIGMITDLSLNALSAFPPVDWNAVWDQLIYHPEVPLIFNSGLFLMLFFGFISIYTLLSKTYRAKAIFVVLFSIFFYYKSSGIYFLLLIACILIDFHIASWIYRTTRQRLRIFLLVISILSNMGMLLYFKYTNFFLETYHQLAGGEFHRLDIFLPIGISFFTFQSLSYTIDVYRRQLVPTSSILDYAFFVSFFPLLVAGPIVRASYFLPQLREPLTVTRESFGRGVFLILCGLVKKAIIADYISINFVDRVFDQPALYSGLENLFAVYGYALQIYCDFSGYSDMAIGIALLLGFHFPDNFNFNSPYRSLNITQFWRRWHISLSTWLRDYLYISLGGNRKGRIRTYLNQFITMVLGGLWHGASLRFLLWGAMHGIGLAVHKIWLGWTKDTRFARRSKIGAGLSWLLTFHFVCFSWIFFRAHDMDTVFQMLQQLWYSFRPELLPAFIHGYPTVVSFIVIGYILHFLPSKWERSLQHLVIRTPLIGKVAIFVVVVYWVIQLKSAEIQPFIYFQF